MKNILSLAWVILIGRCSTTPFYILLVHDNMWKYILYTHTGLVGTFFFFLILCKLEKLIKQTVDTVICWFRYAGHTGFSCWESTSIAPLQLLIWSYVYLSNSPSVLFFFFFVGKGKKDKLRVYDCNSDDGFNIVLWTRLVFQLKPFSQI